MSLKTKREYFCLGVMSGTSLDGIDLAYCSLKKENQWHYSFLHTETIPYPPSWKKRMEDAVSLSEEKLAALDNDYTKYLGKTIHGFLQRHKIDALDVVCSHGHTVHHRPEKGITFQIGNLPEIAHYTQQTVICDFRQQDVNNGGQGAPLVPIGDRLLFPEYDYCLNLGGFANVSFEHQGKRLAYDICPVNIVLNWLAEQLDLPYDNNGAIAAGGKMIPEVLQQLQQLVYYELPPPKSLGLEWVKEYIFPKLHATNASVADLLHTYTEHAALQLAANFPENASVLVTGGGAYNTYLLERVMKHKKLLLQIPDAALVAFKEALVFALLGVLKLRGEVNCLSSVTGAKADHSSGTVFIKPDGLL